MRNRPVRNRICCQGCRKIILHCAGILWDLDFVLDLGSNSREEPLVVHLIDIEDRNINGNKFLSFVGDEKVTNLLVAVLGSFIDSLGDAAGNREPPVIRRSPQVPMVLPSFIHALEEAQVVRVVNFIIWRRRSNGIYTQKRKTPLDAAHGQSRQGPWVPCPRATPNQRGEPFVALLFVLPCLASGLFGFYEESMNERCEAPFCSRLGSSRDELELLPTLMTFYLFRRYSPSGCFCKRYILPCLHLDEGHCTVTAAGCRRI